MPIWGQSSLLRRSTSTMRVLMFRRLARCGTEVLITNSNATCPQRAGCGLLSAGCRRPTGEQQLNGPGTNSQITHAGWRRHLARLDSGGYFEMQKEQTNPATSLNSTRLELEQTTQLSLIWFTHSPLSRTVELAAQLQPSPRLPRNQEHKSRGLNCLP